MELSWHANAWIEKMKVLDKDCQYSTANMNEDANDLLRNPDDIHAIISSLGYFIDGYNINVISAFTLLLEKFHFFLYTPLQIGLVSGSTLLGAGVSAIFFGKLADAVGRRWAYLSYLLIFVVAPIAAALVQNLAALTVARFCIGIAIGGDYSVAPVYSVEMLQEKRRAAGYGQIWAFWSLGSAAAIGGSFFLFVILGPDSWRASFALAALPAAILLLLRMRMPESRMWATRTGSTHANMARKQQLHQETRITPKRKIPRRYLPLMAVALAQWTLLDIGSYGVGLYGPLIASGAGHAGLASLWIVALFYFLAFMAMVMASGLGDKIGRKNLQLLGFALLALSLAIMASSYAFPISGRYLLGLIGLGMWYIVENIGPSLTTKYYSMELFPTRFRSTSMGYGTAITRFVSFLSAFEFPLIVAAYGISYFFAFLLAVMLSAAAFTHFFTPDTRGVSLEEMETMRYRKGELEKEDSSVER